MGNYAGGMWMGVLAIAAGCGDNIVPGGLGLVDGRLGDDSSLGDGSLGDGSLGDGGLGDGGLADGGLADGGAPDASSACVQPPVALGAAATFGVLGGAGVTNTGLTVVTGDLGTWSDTSISGFGPGVVTGTQYPGTTPAMLAQASLTTAYGDAMARPAACATGVAGNLGGRTLTAGLYKSTGSLAVSSGDLTLDGGGDANAVFVFQVEQTLTLTGGRKIVLSNGAQARNVFWQIGTSATLGTNSITEGTIMANAAISLLTGATLHGRALARTASVTLDSNPITVP